MSGADGFLAWFMWFVCAVRLVSCLCLRRRDCWIVSDDEIAALGAAPLDVIEWDV